MSDSLTLTRYYTPLGTFGILEPVNDSKLYTVERVWLDNQPNVSCIPEGEYDCVPYYFSRGGYAAVEVTNVPNRSDILMHIANRPEDVEGCIGIGAKLGCLGNNWGVVQSKVGFNKLMLYNPPPFRLKIVSHPLGSN